MNTNSKKPIRLALVGLGRMGNNYLNSVKPLKNIQICWICSKTQKSLESFPSTYGKTSNYKTLVLEKDLDGVIIATPAPTHFGIAAFFLKKGIPLLIEKPLTNNLKEAVKLLKLQKKTPVLTGHTLLYHKSYLQIKRELKNIGQIKSLEFIGANNNPRSDTSVLFDWGSHGIALFLDLLREDPVQSTITNVDRNNSLVSSVNATLNFPHNINAYLKVSWRSGTKKRRLTVKGTKKILVFDDIANPFKPLSLVLEDFRNTIKGNNLKSDLKFGVRVMRVLDALNGHLEQLSSP